MSTKVRTTILSFVLQMDNVLKGMNNDFTVHVAVWCVSVCSQVIQSCGDYFAYFVMLEFDVVSENDSKHIHPKNSNVQKRCGAYHFFYLQFMSLLI